MFKRILYVVVFVAAFFVMKFVVQEVLQYRSDAELNEEAMQRFDQAVEDNPNLHATEAIQKEAKVMSKEILSNAKTRNEKLHVAASAFMGFYTINSRTRVKFCNNYDVDIFQFLNEFSEANKKEYTKAKAILNQNGISVDELYSSIEPTLEKIIRTDMQDISNIYQLSMKESCDLFNTAASEIVSNLQFSESSPEAYHILMEQ